MKTEWDTADRGVHVVIGAEEVKDLIPTNRWLKRDGGHHERVAGSSQEAEDRPRGGCTRAGQVLRLDQGQGEHLHVVHPAYLQASDEEMAVRRPSSCRQSLCQQVV